MELKEIEVQKLNLKENDTLLVKVKSDYISNSELTELGDGLRNIFKNNKVVVLSVGENESIDLTIVSDKDYNIENDCEPNNKCQNCHCESIEGEK